MPLEDLLVIQDDPVVDADDLSVADRVIVGLDGGMALRVVAHMEENLHGRSRNGELRKERARARALLVHRNHVAMRPVGIADGVCAALGDAGEQSLRGQRPVDPGVGLQAISGNTTHKQSLQSA